MYNHPSPPFDAFAPDPRKVLHQPSFETSRTSESREGNIIGTNRVISGGIMGDGLLQPAGFVSNSSHPLPPNPEGRTRSEFQNTQSDRWFGSAHHTSTSTQQMLSANNVIPPPQSKEELESTKSSYVVIDSRSRNHTDYPLANQYTIALTNEIRDVSNLQLVSYQIPTCQYPIRKTNNVFYYTTTKPSVLEAADEGGVPVVELNKWTTMKSVEVPVGTYADLTEPHELKPDLYSEGHIAHTFKAQVLQDNPCLELHQDGLSTELEKTLTDEVGVCCLVHIDRNSKKYTLRTNFLDSTGEVTRFFLPLFQGKPEYYGPTTVEKVRVHPNVNGCDPTSNAGVTSNNIGEMMKYEKCGKTQTTYLPNSVGQILGHDRNDSRMQVGGQLEFEEDGTSLMLKGTDTRFTEQLKNGDWLFLCPVGIPSSGDGNGVRIRVMDVESDTCVELDATSSSSSIASGTPVVAWVGRLEFPWIRMLDPDAYMAMYINNASTLHSPSQALDRAFYLVPGNAPFYQIPQDLPFKKFTPVLGKMDKLQISFRNADGTLYDFNGQDHVLMFRVVHFRQNINYSDF